MYAKLLKDSNECSIITYLSRICFDFLFSSAFCLYKYICMYIFFWSNIYSQSEEFLFDILFLGMSRALLESVRIPCSKSTTKEWYNVVLLEKLLHILYSACQYGLFQKIILFQSQSRNSDPRKKNCTCLIFTFYCL